jgi:hypothetical protein
MVSSLEYTFSEGWAKNPQVCPSGRHPQGNTSVDWLIGSARPDMLCLLIVYTDLNRLFCKIWFPSPACGA